MDRLQLIAAALSGLMLLAAVPGGTVAVTTPETVAAQETGDSVNVTTGQQLSTVISVTSDDVESEVEESAFEAEYENASEERRAEAVADRAETLRDRAEAIREDYEDATEAYEEGELSRSAYAQRLATLNARAENVVEAYDRLDARAANVSALELRSAGLNRTATQAAVEDLDSVRGSGAAALLQRYTGQSQGEVEVETSEGLSISVENEDGESSREFERPGDDSMNLTVSQSDALDTARTTLPDANGTWVLSKSTIDREDGTYEFAFELDSQTTEGKAEATVDGSAGTVVSFESELEPRDDDREGEREDDEERENETEEDDDEERDDELALLIADGTVAANETVTVQALADGEPADNATIALGDETVGTTGADGTLQVTLPEGGEVELSAVRGESEGELEFDLGGETERENRELARNLDVDATVANGTATVTATYDGDGIANATVSANGEQVGTTDADGVATFAVANDSDELTIELAKGEFEAAFEYERVDGVLTLTEEEIEGPDSENDEEAEEEETESDEDEETEEDEEETETEEEATETEDEEETETEQEATETEDEEETEEETETAEAEDDD